MTALTAQPNTLHASLIDALAGLDPERALEQAFIQLSRGGNLPLLLAMIKTLVRVELGGIAVQLLRSASGLLAAEPQLALLAEQLERMPSGEISSAILQSRLQKNLAAALSSRPHLQSFLITHIADLGVRVFASNKGNHYVLREGNGKMNFVFPFADQVAHVQAMSLPETTLASSFLMIGVPNAALWRKLHALKLTSGYMPPIDIVEPDAEILHLWMCLIDDAESFNDERVSIFSGTNAVEEYRNFLINHRTRRPALNVITNFRPRWHPPVIDKAFNESIAETVAARQRREKAALDEQYALKDAAFWRERFATANVSSPPLRVVGFTSRYSTVIQHAMRDLAGAFARQGCEFEVIKQANPYTASVDVIGELARLHPDLLVVINHLRFEFADAIPANLPYVCWIQDHMHELCTRQAGQSVNDLDVIISHSPGMMASQYSYPIDRCIESSNLTDPHTYSAARIADCDLKPYRCDVSFVSHGSAKPEQLVDAIAAGSIPQFRVMLLRALELIREHLRHHDAATQWDLISIMLQAEHETKHPLIDPYVRRVKVLPQIASIYDRVFRHQALEWTMRWAKANNCTLRIYGRGWEQNQQFAAHACGEIKSGYPLRCLYQASNINLQINGYASLHQRLLDGVASGAFVLSRYNPNDFVREPYEVVQQAIQSNNLSNLSQLLALADQQEDVREAIDHIAQRNGLQVAPQDDPRRRTQIAWHRAVGFDERLTRDNGLFAALCSSETVPQRIASDLPGFRRTTFASEQELCQHLNHFSNDPHARLAVVQAMREAVLQHDTYDILVVRLLARFTSCCSKAV